MNVGNVIRIAMLVPVSLAVDAAMMFALLRAIGFGVKDALAIAAALFAGAVVAASIYLVPAFAQVLKGSAVDGHR